jgi:hypothetical protein
MTEYKLVLDLAYFTSYLHGCLSVSDLSQPATWITHAFRHVKIFLSCVPIGLSEADTMHGATITFIQDFIFPSELSGVEAVSTVP